MIADVLNGIGDAVASFVEGLVDGIVGIVEGLVTIIVEAGIVTISNNIPDIIEPDILKGKSDEIKTKYGEMVTNAIEDPFSILESIGQDVTDTMEEEGIMYMTGNMSTSLIPYVGVVGKAKWLKAVDNGKGPKTTEFDYRSIQIKTNDLGETLATTKQIKEFKKKWSQSGIPVKVDKKGKILIEGYEAAFDFGKGQIYIKKKPTVINLYHEGFHAEQWLDIGKDAYVKQSRLEREEYVFQQIIKNQHLFDDASITHSIEYINRLRLKYK